MRGTIGRRVRGQDGERGVYAVLYAALVVVMIGISALVVDLTTLRQSRMDNRAAADSAVIAGATFLDPLANGGVQPAQACEAAWDYLEATVVGLLQPSGACTTAPNDFPAVATSCPSTPFGGPVLAAGGGGYYVTVQWPVPESSPFLDPNVGQGDADQPFAAVVDGDSAGCERIGVAIEHQQEFLLGSVLDVNSGRTVSASVARLDPDGGPPDEVAALNVLETVDCEALVTLGGGKVLVAPTVKDDVVVGPGMIAVESDGNGTCTGQGTVISPNTSSGGSLICASTVEINAAGTNCDGLGVIRSHALDPGGQRAYAEAAVANGNLRPRPTPENGQYGWNPVTKLYGCVLNSSGVPVALSRPAAGDPCAKPLPPTNYINLLKGALGGSGLPSSPYAHSPSTAAFQAVPATVCSNISTAIALAAGNWYANCHINVNNGGSLLIAGGTLVVEKGISVGSGGCFLINSAATTCTANTANMPPVVNPGKSDATTVPPPLSEAVVYLRGNGCPASGCFETSGKTIMPQTFVFSTSDHMTVNSTDVTLWTAAGAGAVSADDRTALEDACHDTVTGTVDQECLNSRFSKLAYWSEFAAPKTKPNNFAGQGALSVVGVFFMPRAYFDVNGGSAYTAASAQFWADKVRINGGAFLGLRPDVRTSIKTPTSAISLIR